ncbi:MAG: patatin-like phospholipase family protein [Candidatus Portnoybacteria bacterium]|nr:patatin-like phospholipase family protein [Candidatus Portnoybacteria bacterium]
MMKFPRKEPTIGLALGSGGAKGLAHIGVIKVLEENSIPIDFIAGTSIGALVGGLFAAMKDSKKVEELAITTNWRELLSLVDPSLRLGLFRAKRETRFTKWFLLGGSKMKKFIEEQIGGKSFNDLQIPFACIATDMKKGEMVVLQKGDVSLAIRASISLPFVFKPVVYEDKNLPFGQNLSGFASRILADGGLSMPIPVPAVKAMGAQLVIAVNLDAAYFSEEREKIGLYQMSQDVLRLLRFHLSKENVKEADLVITPKVANVGWDKFLTSEKTRQVIQAGEGAMREALPQLNMLIKQKSKTIFQRFIIWLNQKP